MLGSISNANAMSNVISLLIDMKNSFVDLIRATATLAGDA
jgi:hypothetical protein